MFGWRARIGVLLPPGNPTVEPELCGMAPTGVSVHFARMEATPSLGPAGGAAGMEERTRAYREGLEGPARALGDLGSDAVYMAPEARELVARELVEGSRPAGRLTSSG